MKNKHEVRGDVTAIILNSRKYGKIETIISTNKLQRADKYLRTWSPAYDKRRKTFYVQGNITLENGKKTAISLHRWITDAPKGTEVDHENHDTLNNTDDNLRVLVKGQNQQNRNGAQKNSKSGHIGVFYVKASDKWGTKCAGKHLGLYETFEEAAKAVDSYRANFLPYSKEAINNEGTEKIVLPKTRKQLEQQSSIKGIHWRKRSKKWAVAKVVNGKRKQFGLFIELSDAISKLDEILKGNKIS